VCHMDIPDFVVAGASKAGTEWLKLCLKEHPEIFVPVGLTPDYFSHRYSNSDQWYRSLFESSKPDQVTGEKSTSYIICPPAARRLYEFNPDVDVFFVLRDPTERAYSHYKMYLRKGKVDDNVDSLLSDDSPLVREGLYYQQMSRFLDYFDRNQVHILLFDDLKTDSVTFLRDMYSRLGVDPSFTPEMADQRYHVTKSRPRFQGLYNVVVAFIRELRKRTHWANRWLEYLRKEGYVNIFHRLNRGEPFPELSDKRRKELADFYREDIEKLEQMIGRDLSHWCSA